MLFEMTEETGPMVFSALPYTPHEIENAMHPYELPPVHYTVCLLYTSMGPLEYINTVRIRTACEHLKKTEEPVADIAHKCGRCV